MKIKMPTACSRQINKALGTMWAQYSKQEKRKYAKEAKEDKNAIALNL